MSVVDRVKQYVDLHGHSSFSNLDGFGMPNEVVERARTIGRESVALTDHGSVSGLVQLHKACEKNNIKPIFGCEFYTVEDIAVMREEQKREKFHLTVVAMNDIGYRNLLQLSTRSYSEGFYYKPTIDKKMLFEHNEGLIVLSGCCFGMLQTHLMNGDKKAARYIADEFKNVFSDRYYLETQHYDIYKKSVDDLNYISNTLEIPMVLTCDFHYLEADQFLVQHLLHCIRMNGTFGEGDIWDGGHQWPAEELYNFMMDEYPQIKVDELFQNTCDVGNRCNVVIPMGNAPRYIPLDGDTGDNARDILWNKCREGIILRGLKGAGEVYRERFNREFELVIQKDFADYFLIVADMVNFAKKKGIMVGPARGSSAGSLICYLIGITEINPLNHDLIFERFIDENRDDLPDIDIDFDKERREEVKDYMVLRYGDDRVCNIATFAKFKGRNTLDDVGRVLRMDKNDIEVVKKFIPDKLDNDEYSDTISDSFEIPAVQDVVKRNEYITMAPLLEGQLRHMGKHAAGIIVGDRPLSDVIALYRRDGDEHAIGSVGMKDAAYLGLLKIDVLSISELTLLQCICDMTGQTVEDLYQIPLDDPKTLEGFRNLDTGGVFQFDGFATTQVMRQLPEINFEVLVACTALSRPGPNDSNTTQDYIDTANAQYKGESVKKHVFNTHPKLRAITDNTYNQIVYQEQALSIVREVGNMSWKDANSVRVAISKKLGKTELDKYYPQFEKGVIENGLTDKDAEMIWNNIETMGRYAFNKSHAVSYTVVSFWSMYMKQHYPLEFYTSMLIKEDEKAKIRRMLGELRTRGIDLYPPVLGKSEQHWKVEGKGLRAGLLAIDGIGEKAADVLINDNYLTPEDFAAKKNRSVNKRTLDALNKHNAFNPNGDDDFFGTEIFSIMDRIIPNREQLSSLDDGPENVVYVACTIESIKYKDIFDEYRKKGKDLSKIKNPKTPQYAVVTIADETGNGILYIANGQWAKIKGMIESAKKNDNVLAFRGIKINNGKLLIYQTGKIFNKKGVEIENG